MTDPPDLFTDRRDAGVRLAAQLSYVRNERPVVLALPRGGVPVAYEIAYELSAPLDVLLVRKIGAPFFPELGVGAIVDGHPPQRVLNEELVKKLNIPPSYLAEEEQRQLIEMERRRKLYCGDRPPLQVHGRTVIVVDDGIATGSTMAVALKALSQEGVDKLIFAVPVAPQETLDRLCSQVNDGVCLLTPPDFQAVGTYYKDFEQTSDEEVISLLARQYADFYATSTRRKSHDEVRRP
jgi:putative phosphoribosyl transferase